MASGEVSDETLAAEGRRGSRHIPSSMCGWSRTYPNVQRKAARVENRRHDKTTYVRSVQGLCRRPTLFVLLHVVNLVYIARGCTLLPSAGSALVRFLCDSTIDSKVDCETNSLTIFADAHCKFVPSLCFPIFSVPIALIASPQTSNISLFRTTSLRFGQEPMTVCRYFRHLL